MKPIPEGWRLMVPGETATREDMCHNREHDRLGWEVCGGVIGTVIGSGQYNETVYTFIRKGQPKPTVEKEWLNPWD